MKCYLESLPSPVSSVQHGIPRLPVPDEERRRINTAADLLHCNHAWPPFAYAYTNATKYLGHAGTITTAD